MLETGGYIRRWMYNMCERGRRRRRRPRSAARRTKSHSSIFLYFSFFPAAALIISVSCHKRLQIRHFLLFFPGSTKGQTFFFLANHRVILSCFLNLIIAWLVFVGRSYIIIYVCTNRRGRLTSASELEREMTVSSLQFYFSFIYLFCLSILR